MSECARFESHESVVLICSCLAQLLAVKRSAVVMETSAVRKWRAFFLPLSSVAVWLLLWILISQSLSPSVKFSCFLLFLLFAVSSGRGVEGGGWTKF